MPLVTERKPNQPYVIGRENRAFPRVFDVEAASEIDAAIVLFNEKGIEKGVVFRNTYGGMPDPNMKCQYIEVLARVAAPLNGTGLYQVTAYYSASPEGGLFGGEPEIDGPVKWSTEISTREVPVDVDLEGSPILNSAGQPIDPPFTRPVTTEIVVAKWIRSNVNFFDAVKLSRRFNNRVNSVAWKGADPREVLCHSLKPESIDDEMIRFEGRFEWRNSIEFGNGSASLNFAPPSPQTVPGWDPAIYDRGHLTIAGPDGDGNQQYDPIKSTDGTTVIETYLNGSGGRLANGEQLVVNTWQLIPEADFNELGI